MLYKIRNYYTSFANIIVCGTLRYIQNPSRSASSYSNAMENKYYTHSNIQRITQRSNMYKEESKNVCDKSADMKMEQRDSEKFHKRIENPVYMYALYSDERTRELDRIGVSHTRDPPSALRLHLHDKKWRDTREVESGSL